MKIFISLCLLSASLTALAQTVPSENAMSRKNVMGFTKWPLWVDIRDVARYSTPLTDEAKIIFDAMIGEPSRFFPAGVRYLKKGPGFDSKTRVNTVYGTEFIEPFGLNAAGDWVFNLVSLVHSDATGFFFRRFAVVVGGGVLKGVVPGEDKPLKQARFRMRVGLVQRKAFLEEPNLGLRMIYPLGTGGFDETGKFAGGKVKLLTPLVKKAYLEKGFVQSSRTEPEYYAGRPFIQLSNPKGDVTPYAFHYSITDTLLRGFESHGCMRMRDKDLYELYAIVMTTGLVAPVTLEYNIVEGWEHPFPHEKARYQRIRNFGTAKSPETRRDPKHHLKIMEEKKGKLPVESFIDEVIVKPE